MTEISVTHISSTSKQTNLQDKTQSFNQFGILLLNCGCPASVDSGSDCIKDEPGRLLISLLIKRSFSINFDKRNPWCHLFKCQYFLFCLAFCDIKLNISGFRTKQVIRMSKDVSLWTNMITFFFMSFHFIDQTTDELIENKINLCISSLLLWTGGLLMF